MDRDFLNLYHSNGVLSGPSEKPCTGPVLAPKSTAEGGCATGFSEASSDSPGQPAARLLHDTCRFRENCWGTRIAEARSASWNGISLPHVGHAYESAKPRLLVMGLNYTVNTAD